jgi:DNA-binding HxlR family transcriptional regulator
VRAGAFALTLLSVPLNVQVLQALEEDPRSLIDLRRAAGSPPQTTMRGHLRALTELGVLERHRETAFPGSIDYKLGASGRALLQVAEVLEQWLAEAPEGPLELGDPAAKSAVKALVDGWTTTIVRALAARASSLTELNKLISDISYPSLERRLGAMRLAGQIEPCPGNGRGTPYAATEWLRQAVAPLLAGARWERDFAPDRAARLGRLDVESCFLLSVPLLDLSANLSGLCRLAVVSRNGNGEPAVAGVMVGIEDGQILSCVSKLQGQATAWAAGGASAWTSALVDHRAERLELGGDGSLAVALVDGLHGTLFRVRQAR